LKAVLAAAIVAVLISATSATAAFVVTSANIKNGTIKLADISPDAKRALRGQRGPRGFTGAPGAQGPQGAQGVPGPAGGGGFDPNKINYVEGAVVTIDPESFGEATATCPAGAKAISGGWLVETEGVGEVAGTRSYDSGGSWTVRVFNWDDVGSATVKPFAVCALQ
jgi:hypothetical protein